MVYISLNAGINRPQLFRVLSIVSYTDFYIVKPQEQDGSDGSSAPRQETVKKKDEMEENSLQQQGRQIMEGLPMDGRLLFKKVVLAVITQEIQAN